MGNLDARTVNPVACVLKVQFSYIHLFKPPNGQPLKRSIFTPETQQTVVGIRGKSQSNFLQGPESTGRYAFSLAAH